MSGFYRMQELTDQSTNTVQDKEDAIDVGSYRTLVIQIRVVGAEGLFQDGEDALVEEQGFSITALFVIQRCEVIQGVDQIGVPGPEDLLSDRQGALVERFGFLIPVLVKVQRREVVERTSYFGVVGSIGLLSD